MTETRASAAPADAGIDLSQFFQVFFDEAGDNLEAMERRLLELDLAAADDEDLNAIFRCAHSVKGGAATFGFADVAALTHQMETLLDRLRRHELAPTPAMVDVLLASGDALRGLLARHQGGGGAEIDTSDLLQSMRTLCAAAAPDSPALIHAAGAPASGSAPATGSAASCGATPPAGPALRVLELSLDAHADPSQADGLVELFRDIDGLGTIEPLAGGGSRRFKVTTGSSDADLLDLFTFHVPREAVHLAPLDATAASETLAPAAAASATVADPGYGFFAGSPGAPAASGSTAGSALPPPVDAVATAPATPGAAARKAEPRPGATLDSATLRVAVEKVDQLINLVGELVITQAMLAQHGKAADAAPPPALVAGLADLERNTRDLQEAVMSIRMIPMSLVFNRFPRMLRDLAAKLGKQVDLVSQGEATELDKGMIERITDPLTHLVRNSVDHGIESPAERVACGKPERGTITLVAAHQGGSIVIEVRDDGRGLNRDKLLRAARAKGLAAPDTLSDAEVWNLILAPGFSTAEVVTDVSGRGVGMDVVKKNISALGGSVEIDSADGYGMSVRVRLPLTLAIMDGMSLGVGDECYLLPLGAVIESFQLRAGMIRTVGASANVVEVRGEYLPVLDLARLFDVPRVEPEPDDPIAVVVEAEGGRVALRVDALLGQQQVVVKNLEANYRKVPDVSGATIMGDGRVALILDVGALVRRCRH